MRVAQFDAFGSPLYVGERDMPVARPHGVVIKVEATGLCRSDWHGWVGEHARVKLGAIPGHEYCGEVVEAVNSTTRRRPTQRLSTARLPLASAC